MPHNAANWHSKGVAQGHQLRLSVLDGSTAAARQRAEPGQLETFEFSPLSPLLAV
jgi:hypothetical protein